MFLRILLLGMSIWTMLLLSPLTLLFWCQGSYHFRPAAGGGGSCCCCCFLSACGLIFHGDCSNFCFLFLFSALTAATVTSQGMTIKAGAITTACLTIHRFLRWVYRMRSILFFLLWIVVVVLLVAMDSWRCCWFRGRGEQDSGTAAASSSAFRNQTR